MLNFGYVPKGTQSTRQFFIENLCEEEVEWKILEFTYDFVEKCVLEINRNCMSVTSGTLQGMGDKKEIRYQVRAVVSNKLVLHCLLCNGCNSVMIITYNYFFTGLVILILYPRLSSNTDITHSILDI